MGEDIILECVDGEFVLCNPGFDNMQINLLDSYMIQKEMGRKNTLFLTASCYAN